jgi:hypothetical protein
MAVEVAKQGDFLSGSRGSFSGIKSTYTFSRNYYTNTAYNSTSIYRAANDYPSGMSNELDNGTFSVAHSGPIAGQSLASCVSELSLGIDDLFTLVVRRECSPDFLVGDNPGIIVRGINRTSFQLRAWRGYVVVQTGAIQFVASQNRETASETTGSSIPVRVFGEALVGPLGSEVSTEFDFTITSLPPHGSGNPLP